jgi:AcrR family transcriptional regulator
MARLDAGARRGQLVQVGVGMLAELPLDQIAADAVARAAGVSKGLVFHYFPTKRDLHVALLRATAADLLQAIDQEPGMPIPERLRAGLDEFVTFIERQPANYRAMIRTAGSDPQLLAVFEDTRNGVVEIIGRALGITDLPPALRMVIRGWIAMVEESALHWVEERPITREQLIDFLQRAATTMLPEAIALTR